MAHRDDIVSFCSELLQVSSVPDAWCENGLQVEGTETVQKIALGVSTSAAFLKEASDWGAEMCLVHHGLFWKKGTVRITGVLKKRLQILLIKNISLVNFHIPLDAHPEVGNNAALADILSLKKREAVSCGFVGILPSTLSFEELKKKVEAEISACAFAESFHDRPIQKVAVISGGSAGFAPEVSKTGADAFIFGELSEHDYHDLKEMELSFLAAGHFATERLGVQRLGEKITEHFSDVEVRFFDEDCPV